MDPNSFQFSSRGELAVKSLFASSAEQRELARSLAVATPIKRDDQHTFFDVSDVDLTLSPIGREILEIVAAQPEELVAQPEMDEIEAAVVATEIHPAAPLLDAAPVVLPTPSGPSAWKNLNFQSDPKRATTNEPGKLRRWEAGRSSSDTGNWDGSRDYLDA
jgi:hypothetical protein